MMGNVAAVAVALLVAGSSGAFAGDDGQGQLVQLGNNNVAHLSIPGSDNAVSLYQQMPPAALDGNTASISIQGDGNGAGDRLHGPLSVGLGLDQALTPGRLIQVGAGNLLALSIVGNANAFAVLQNGGGNVLRGSVTGSLNQAVVIQRGGGNTASFSQRGTGNILSITQVAR